MRFALCLTVDRHGLRPRDDKVCKISEWHRYNTIFVIARKEQSEGRGNPSCLEGTRTGFSLRFLAHSGSPRATPSR